MILLNTRIHKINIKVKKIWQQEEEEQRRKLEGQQEEDADNKGIYSFVIKLNKGYSIEIGKLGTINFPQGLVVQIVNAPPFNLFLQMIILVVI